MSWDGIVIGGGPAGMMAAITAAQQGSRVLLLERNDRPGKKLLITGKGRCNVTNHCTAQEALQNVPRNGRFLYSAMAAFPPEEAEKFFRDGGCPLKVERGNRVFPESDRSSSVLDCLTRMMRQHHVTVRTGVRVKGILTTNGAVSGVRTESETLNADWVILATGGVSYPLTGSTGDGYAMASALGHTVTPPEGSLVPLETAGPDAPEMQGLSLRNVGVKLIGPKGKLLYQDFGELLFTHFGVSGPTVLSASAHLKGECRLVLDLKPALDEGKLDSRILRDLEKYQNRAMENALTDLLPRSMIPVVLRRLEIDPALQANSLKKQQRRALVTLLKAFSLEITGKRPVEEAIITSGGVKVGEVDPKTMESKKIPGLFLAGELLDCDAYTGGFNLQIAWATGRAAGLGAAALGRTKISR